MNIPNHHFIFWGEILRNNKKKSFRSTCLHLFYILFKRGPVWEVGEAKIHKTSLRKRAELLFNDSDFYLLLEKNLHETPIYYHAHRKKITNPMT